MKDEFEFKYTAPTSEERKEIESIRNSYLVQDKTGNKLNYLRHLDNKVKHLPMIISIIIGVVGILIFGLGLTMILEWNLFVLGIIIGFVGVVIMLVVYPIYLAIKQTLKNKYSKEILKISDELLNDENR